MKSILVCSGSALFLCTCAVDARRNLLGINLKEVSLDESCDLDDIAKLTEGYSGADITNLCR